MPPSALADSSDIPARTSSETAPDSRSPRQKARDAGDLMRVLNHFVFIPCVCGMTIKVPPDFRRDVVPCPRCRREHDPRAARPLPDAGRRSAGVPPEETARTSDGSRGEERGP